MALLCLPTRVHAICGLEAAFFEQIRSLENPDTAQSWARQISRQGGASCAVCHIAAYGPRNAYGTAINVLLTGNDREDAARKREAGRRVNEIPADPSMPDSPTFGDLISSGSLPAADFTTDLPTGLNVPAAQAEEVTVERARELVRRVQAESRFGILQLSRAVEVKPDVAAELAEFRGEMLILGLTTLPPDVARALATSQAAPVWLHSVTSVPPETAEAIARLPGHLVLSGLVELDSVPLAKKLARRPGALSLPSLRRIGLESAAALAENPSGLNLAALTDLSPAVQETLAKTVGALTAPNLTSLDSMPLTRKLAAGYASSVLLPRIGSLSVEQAEAIASVNRPFFLGGTFLPLTVMTDDVAAVFAKSPAAGRLTLGAGPISDSPFSILVQSPLSLELREVEALNDEQVRILAMAPDRVPGGPFGNRNKISVPSLSTLDSPLLATTLLRCSGVFPGVTTISPEAAAAIGSVPVAAAGVRDGTGLSFPSLEHLGPETARLLAQRRWATISLPSLQDASPETIRSLVRQTSAVILGITTMTPELASAFGEMASNEIDLGGGQLSFPCLTRCSPEAARALVESLNRGKEVPVWGGLDRSPQLFIGGRGFSAICPVLTPALAGELAKYRGRLAIAGLQALSPESALALASYRGPSLDLSGPAIDTLSPETAAALATFPGDLRIPLRVLESVPLAAKLARQSARTLDGLEFISAESIPECVAIRNFFTLRQLPVLESPKLAARLIQDSAGQVLPSLRSISLAAAEELVRSPNKIVLGLAALDDEKVALALTQSQKGVSLPRLRAATPAVKAIVSSADSITTPPLESLYDLPEKQ